MCAKSINQATLHCCFEMLAAMTYVASKRGKEILLVAQQLQMGGT